MFYCLRKSLMISMVVIRVNEKNRDSSTDSKNRSSTARATFVQDKNSTIKSKDRKSLKESVKKSIRLMDHLLLNVITNSLNIKTQVQLSSIQRVTILTNLAMWNENL